ncbi:PDZ and LIM domain protein Zasp-like isoform X2 [Condylostylus longicornis]|uniref:PDZ and LIM domain protein Zasp-like isoform X2 n=1 Tax=Condylostylus longicornis TaxID=2530218 RepID=UPI00244DF4EE|nr:PDZ and LIM domain protein Zasp-like isoform X2 [Condylostylus longicornis]
MTIQRGGSLWRPHVTPTGQLPAHQSHLGNNVQTVTRTSLAHKHPQPVEHIGCGYNNAARPFSAVNGSDGQLKSIVNKQYNTPVGIYSEESIAETLTAQAEVLAGGVLGVNFKKHEKEYNPTNSEVLKFLNEEQSEPREPASHCRSPGGRIRTPVSHSATPAPANKTESDDRTGTPTIQQNKEQKSYQQQQNQQPKQQPQQQVIQPKPKAIPYFIQKHMQQAQPDVDLPPKEIAETDSSSGQAVCCSCGTHITGVFCRIKDKNLHVECFKCATCGTSLKNQGYYNFNNKLYCDIHAKAAAMKNPPPGTEGYVPIPLKPTPKLTAGHIANALNAHGYNLQTNGATPALVTGSAPPAGGNVSQGYAPRPFNQGQLSPPSGSQRSPGSGAPSWSQPRPAPIVAQSPYATLPRTGSSQGRHSYSSHSSSNAYSANKSHVTFGPNTYSRPVPIQSAYNNVNIYNRGEGQTQNEIQIQEEPQPKVKHPDHFEDLEVETLNQPPVSTRPFTWPPKESETQDMAPTATPIYIPPPGTQHVLVKEHQEDVMRKQEEEIQRQQIVKEEHRQVQRQEQQQKTVQTQQKTQEYYEQQQLSQQESRQQQQQEQQQWQVRSAPQLNSHYHVEVESGSDSYTSTSTTTTTTSEEYNRMYQAQLQAYQMQQMYDQSGSEYDYHMEIDQHNVRQEQDHCYSMSSDIHSIQSGRRSVQECADNLQSTLSMYKLIDMVREVTPSPTPMNKPRRVEFLDSEETLEQKSKKEETLTVNETAQQTTEKNVTEEKEQSKPGEEERRQSVVEEIIVPQKVSSVGSSEDTGRRIIITPIEESTERLFPPTPEIKVIFPPPLILPPSNIPNPVPKEWINPMVKALTIAPDKPIELHPGLDEYLSDIQEEQSAADLTAETEQTTSSTQPAEYYCSTVECKSSSKIPGDTSKLTCIESCQNVCSGTCSERAAEAPCTTCPMSKGNICCKKNQSQNETIQQSILKEEPPKGSKISKTLTSVPEYKFQFAPAAGEYIPLPEETKPYMPPPIDMTPYTKEDFRPKSPMLSALITAPDEPYKRFESDVCSQLLDMPTVSEKLTLSDALITAPERAYSPLSTDNILKLGLDQPPTKPEYIHLSLEEQKAETEQKVFEKRQESMDRKISAFVSLDDHSVRSGAYTPSFTNKPAPIIPYYQTPEKLVFEECSSVEARPYDRRSASPFPDRTHSPAPGPPPNPLKTIAIHAPRIKENTLNVVPRSPMGGSITTGQSYLGTQMAQQQQEQILSHYQTGMDSGSRSLIDKPEIIQERQIGDLHVQTKQKESHLQEEKKSEQETQTKSQIGNMQIERRRKVVEEYEHSQSAKTVEIRTQSQGEKKNQYGKTGFVANQARRLSGLEEEISSLTSQSQAISARAANLGVRSETRFPETKSPTPSNAFPIKPVLPPHDQPKMPTYIVPSPSDNKLAGAPPGFVHRYDQFNQQIPDATQSKSTACAASSISKRSQSLTTSSLTFGQKSKLMTSDIPTLTPTAPQHYVGGPLTSNLSTSSIASNSNTITSSLTNTTTSRDTQEQNISKFTSSTNTYRPTASTGPAGFKPPPPGAIQVLPHPLPTPSSGVTTPKQQSSASHDTRQVIFPPTPEQLIQDDLFKTKQTATAAAATANSTFNTTSMQSAIASSASFASNQTTSSINSTTNIDTKSAADTGVGGKSGGSFSATSAPKRGRGILNKAVGPGSRIPQCGACQTHIRGPFITALGRIWCPDHFMCVNGSCRRPLQDIGFVEEKGDLYCEFCFEKYLAPTCSKCNGKIKGDCLNAIGKHFHPECFTCAYCGKLFGNTPFFLEDGEPYCEADWNELFTTKCFACGFPVEAGDRWVEALNHNYHSQCFNCTMCKKNLEGQSFFNKGGRPFCKNHAR